MHLLDCHTLQPLKIYLTISLLVIEMKTNYYKELNNFLSFRQENVTTNQKILNF